ncbi:glycosyltransferase [Paenibacillus sp. 5J-6]|uniref:Glycosyltransferase n=1 Tax=Paenibacillus silvestris TaxID=2606219 RepID=A0A6L8V266_9BACL|nr:glycosyltransferase family 1 protein [Paenibacillus silvestris]MZQ83646.1 glycosyltransferase [Paenibacillus silvestris]
MGGPVRVLHAVVNMNRGGAEVLIMNLYRNIDRTMIQFDFLTCKEGEFDAEIIEMGGRIHRIPYVSDVGHFAYINALNKFFLDHSEYKIVHSHMDKMSGFVLRSAKRAGVPVRIAHSHSTNNEGSFLKRMYKMYAGKSIISNATHLLACSKNAAKWLFKKEADKADILKNGIECEKFLFSSEVREQVREELNLQTEDVVVGHVGRFCHPKNHTFLLDIFYEFSKLIPNSVLVLAGDGPLRSDIEMKVKKLNLENRVKLLGVRNDINRLLQAYDVFVFPSIYEGLPVTLIEAQGAGLPCVISDVVTKEVDLGVHLIEYSSLFDQAIWVEKIRDIAARNRHRETSASILFQKGYDIRHSAKWTQEFYLQSR